MQVFSRGGVLSLADDLECHENFRRGIAGISRFGEQLVHLSMELLLELDQSFWIVHFPASELHVLFSPLDREDKEAGAEKKGCT